MTPTKVERTALSRSYVVCDYRLQQCTSKFVSSGLPGGPRTNCEDAAPKSLLTCGGEVCLVILLCVLLPCFLRLRPVLRRRRRRSLFRRTHRAGTWKDKPSWLNIRAASAY